MDNNIKNPTHFIQLNSEDSIFEWNVPGNKIYLTNGARSILGLGDKYCLTLDEFTSHTPHDERLELMTFLSSFLRGAGGPYFSMSLTFDGMNVSARMIVVNRKRDGSVTHVIGCLHGHSGNLINVMPEEWDTGFWRLKPLQGTLTLDKKAMAILGSPKPAITEITIDQIQTSLHPEDAVRFLNHYEILFREGLWEGEVNESFRYRLASGKYRRFTLSAVVIERDDQGRVVEMIGVSSLVHNKSFHGTASEFDSELESELESENFLNAIAGSEDGLWDWNVADNQFFCSPRYLSMLGYTKDTFPTSFDKAMKLVHPDEQEKYDSILQKYVETPEFGKSFEIACRMLKADQEYAWLLVRGYITNRDENGKALRVIALNTDISGTQNDWGRLEEQIRNDELTGLRSRSFLIMERERIEKSNLRPVSVIVVDLNGLKLVNDYLGHHVGDLLLQNTATQMRQVFRTTDCMARVGGDEFTVLLPACTGENAKALAIRLAKEFESYNVTDNRVPLLASIGVGSAETPDETLAQAFLDADKEMLRNKHKSRPESLRILKEFIQRSEDVVVRLDECRYL